MAREFAKAFYQSRQWQKCRAAYIAYRKSIDGGMCESCHEVPGYIVHHKIHLTPENINDPDISLGFGNLKYDCHACHNAEHGAAAVPGLIEYTFDSQGNLVPVPTKNDQGVGEHEPGGEINFYARRNRVTGVVGGENVAEK